MSVCYTKVLFHFCCCSACHKSPKQLLFHWLSIFFYISLSGCCCNRFLFLLVWSWYRSWSVSGFISDKQGIVCPSHWRIVQVDGQTLSRQQRQSFYSLFPILRNREILAYSLDFMGIGQTEKHKRLGQP